ncbi:hypothetical protein ACVOMV_17555 [Mesorhizobium atlanticum]
MDAQVALGEMLYNGRGGERSVVAAAHLFKQAAAAGHAGAMFAIGALYESGQGVSINTKAAQKWFAAAAEREHGHAQLIAWPLSLQGHCRRPRFGCCAHLA